MILMDKPEGTEGVSTVRQPTTESAFNYVTQFDQIRIDARIAALEEAAVYADKYNAGIGGGIRALKKNR